MSLISKQLLAIAVGTTAVIAQRSRTQFDFNWKYILGAQNYAPSCDATGFTQNISGTQCYGLNQADAATPQDCQNVCGCDNTCLIWQWDTSNSQGACWTGSDCSQNVSNAAWTSFERTPPAPTPPTEPPCTDPSFPCSVSYTDAAWRTVNTPHDFIVEGAFSPDADRGHGYLPFNISWYRKHFTVQANAEGSLIWLDFDGVYKNSDMWLNGVWLGHFTSGYVSFRYYLHNATAPGSTTPVLVYGGGDNVLAVRVDALTAQEGWFYEGGGITRHVWLNMADPLSVVPWGAYYPSAVTGGITSGPLGAMGPQTAETALISAAVDVANARPATTNFTLTITVLDATGTSVGSSVTQNSLPSGGWARYTPTINLGLVNLWNTESTYLYTVTTEVTVAGSTVDSTTVSIGVRNAIWTANTGFMLNGFKVNAQGFSNHQDFAGCGTAVPDRVNEYRVTSMRAIGSNFWRTAHNPTNPELLDYADKHGMLMWVENRFINVGVQPLSSKSNPDPATVAVANPQLLQDAQSMVLRDRNHPSVVIWSLCNEGGCEIGAVYGGVIGAQFKDVISAADTMRPITANSEWGTGSADSLTNIMDVMTCSYNYGLYTLYHVTHPWKPIMGGESASCTSDRGYYLPNNATNGHLNSANGDGCVVSAWASAIENLWDSGNFAWTGHDYKGEPSPLNWPDVNSHFGVLDLAGYEKDTAGYYRAWWRGDGATYLKLVPGDWTDPVPVGTPISLRAFTGAAFVEAFVNDVSQGKVAVPPFGIVTWPPVPFIPGNISAVAYDASGNSVATQVVSSVGVPAAIVVTVETVGPSTYAADGQDVGLFRVTIVDAKGAFVAYASNVLTFTISGPGAVYGLGNGDPADHTPDKVGLPDLPYGGVWTRPAFMGMARAVVQTQAGSPGVITLSVASPGLTTGTATITSQ